MEAIQLELFEIPQEEKTLGELRSLEKTVDNLRRGMFGRHDELGKKFLELRGEVERLQESLHLMREELKAYRETFGSIGACFGAGVAVLSGLRSTVSPVSALITSSQACSTGLSGPNHL